MADPKLPTWILSAEKTLREASTRVRMIAATTPVDLAGELERLRIKWQAGDACAPQFAYHQRQDHHEIIAALQGLAKWLDQEGPLGTIYADRAREIAAEAAVCSAVGTEDLRLRARERFCRRDDFDLAADKLAQDWLDEPLRDSTEADGDFVRSDDLRDARSLLFRLRVEMGARKIPFRVVVARDSSALAATGDSFVQIARDRWMSVADVERTVLHEIEGHVLPRCRANAQRLGIFALGTRFGVDDQEGRALRIERQAGHLRSARRRELAYRHQAARMLEEDADFVETARALLRVGASIPDALRITARVFRGGGLGREIVYLPAFLRVDAMLEAHPDLDVVLGAGRVSVVAAEILRGFIDEMH